jgi:hypothetical protein
MSLTLDARAELTDYRQSAGRVATFRVADMYVVIHLSSGVSC